MPWTLFSVMVLTAGCRSPGDAKQQCSDAAGWLDQDGDGYGDPDAQVDSCAEGVATNDEDCDDASADVHPGAPEVCNGFDDDCNGRADIVPTWFEDSDADGYGAIGGAEKIACVAPDGFASETGDCDDTEQTVHPGAAETCNAIDDDCDEVSDEGFDADGDGHWALACPAGDDCDDADAESHPGATEVCGDDLDNDCDGAALECPLSGVYWLSDADAKVYATEAHDDMARRIRVGDIDGDGTLDVFAATKWGMDLHGGARVLFGPLSGTHTADDVGIALSGSGTMSQTGFSIALGDPNGDGYADVEIAAPELSAYSTQEGAYVQFGPITADMDLADASVHFDGNGSMCFGYGSEIGDINGDEVDDVVVGAPHYGDDWMGAVFVEYGPISAGETSMLDDYDGILIGTSGKSHNLGWSVAAGKDMDGDGIGDVLAETILDIGAKTWGVWGAVLVASGPLDDEVDVDVRAIYLQEAQDPCAQTGDELAQGDLDGDGYADALVGAPAMRNAPCLGGGSNLPIGRAYVVSGTSTGVIDLADADVVITGSAPNGMLGSALALGDVEGDGEPELVVSAPWTYVAGAYSTGAIHVFHDIEPGSWFDYDADAMFIGEGNGDGAGQGLALADMDDDGNDDLLIGAPADATGDDEAGALYLLTF